MCIQYTFQWADTWYVMVLLVQDLSVKNVQSQIEVLCIHVYQVEVQLVQKCQIEAVQSQMGIGLVSPLKCRMSNGYLVEVRLVHVYVRLKKCRMYGARLRYCVKSLLVPVHVHVCQIGAHTVKNRYCVKIVQYQVEVLLVQECKYLPVGGGQMM